MQLILHFESYIKFKICKHKNAFALEDFFIVFERKEKKRCQGDKYFIRK